MARIETPAQVAGGVIESALKIYSKAHGGALPGNWKDLDAFILEREVKAPGQDYEKSYLFRSLEQQLGKSVEETFMLLGEGQNAVAMTQPDPNMIFSGGRIVAIITSRIVDDRRKEIGRYVIWRDPKGSLQQSWLDESVVQAQFEKADCILPTGPLWTQPSALGPDGALAEYSQSLLSIALVIVIVIIVGGITFFIHRRLRS